MVWNWSDVHLCPLALDARPLNALCPPWTAGVTELFIYLYIGPDAFAYWGNRASKTVHWTCNCYSDHVFMLFVTKCILLFVAVITVCRNFIWCWVIVHITWQVLSFCETEISKFKWFFSGTKTQWGSYPAIRLLTSLPLITRQSWKIIQPV